MYKYIIYCSISAVIIIAAKYVYQNWIKQNHTIATIKQDILLLQNKVKNVEDHFEKTKGSMSGGVSIPIVFKKLDTPQKVEQPNPPSPIKTKNVVELKNDLDSSSSSFSTVSSGSEPSRHSNHSNKSNQSNKQCPLPDVIKLSPKKDLIDDLSGLSSISSSKSSKSSSKKKVLNLNDVVEPKQAEVEVKSPEPVPEPLVETVETSKKTVKKKALPDAKDYNNGDKIVDDQGVEHLCIVGKRGGHSWKKLEKITLNV